MDSDCSGMLQYNIMSNCGTCAGGTTDGTVTSVTCSIDLPAVTDKCSFGIQSVICTNMSGVSSTPLNITLKGICYTIDTSHMHDTSIQGKLHYA